MTMAGATVFVCISCNQDDTQSPRPGAVLYDAVAAEVSARGLDLQVTPVECLSVCKRPCTIAFAAEGKWTYVIGDLEAGTHVDDIVTGAERYAASTNGIVPWRERPVPVRRGVVARVPPMHFKPGDPR
jgi:predicted metal-binding protein